ncbi:GNAT family N-acetyltransferase [Asanoa sp. NPDC049518]|uniref:GNAT family N-acetyltransferase n=1 Tax=unclassified Asanoa TaxID=2685164 RepID=UPI0034238127
MADVDALVNNAVAMWAGAALNVSVDPRVFRVETPRMTRLILRAPASAGVVTELLESVPPTKAAVLEDAFGAGRAEPPDPTVRVLDMPVMVRPPGTVRVSGEPAQVARVTTPDDLALAERTIVEGFPVSALRPWRKGEALPARVLNIPGCSVWLAHLRDQPAAAGCTFDDGAVVGVYWLATLPEYRFAGLGRAVMTKAINTRPDRPFVLTATDAGRPLYESMNFRAVTTTTWYMRPANASRIAADRA